MKKNLSLALALFIGCLVHGQNMESDDAETSRPFFLYVSTGFGNGQIVKEDLSTSVSNISSSSLGLRYTLNSGLFFDLQTSLIQADYNEVVNGNAVFSTNHYFELPLGVGYVFILAKDTGTISDRIFLTAQSGVFYRSLSKLENQMGPDEFEESSLGSNFGYKGELGVQFNLSDLLHLGINYVFKEELGEYDLDAAKLKSENEKLFAFSVGLTF